MRGSFVFGQCLIWVFFSRQDGDAFGARRLSQVLIEGGKRKAKTHR